MSDKELRWVIKSGDGYLVDINKEGNPELVSDLDEAPDFVWLHVGHLAQRMNQLRFSAVVGLRTDFEGKD